MFMRREEIIYKKMSVGIFAPFYQTPANRCFVLFKVRRKENMALISREKRSHKHTCLGNSIERKENRNTSKHARTEGYSMIIMHPGAMTACTFRRAPCAYMDVWDHDRPTNPSGTVSSCMHACIKISFARRASTAMTNRESISAAPCVCLSAQQYAWSCCVIIFLLLFCYFRFRQHVFFALWYTNTVDALGLYALRFMQWTGGRNT